MSSCDFGRHMFFIVFCCTLPGGGLWILTTVQLTYFLPSFAPPFLWATLHLPDTVGHAWTRTPYGQLSGACLDPNTCHIYRMPHRMPDTYIYIYIYMYARCYVRNYVRVVCQGGDHSIKTFCLIISSSIYSMRFHKGWHLVVQQFNFRLKAEFQHPQRLRWCKQPAAANGVHRR